MSKLRKGHYLSAVLLAAFVALILASPALIGYAASLNFASGGTTYSNVTTTVGISESHTLSGVTCAAPPLSVGSAWADYDNDGDVDVFMTDHGGANQLYRNEGDTNMDLLPDFTNQAGSLGIEAPGKTSISAVFIDYDNDGDQDLYVTNWDGNTMWENLLSDTGTISFTNATTSTGLLDEGRGITQAWGDYDQDGFLDLYIAKHRDCGVPDVDPHDDRLYHNDGAGAFTNATDNLCVGTAPCSLVDNLGFAPVWTDYDNDKDLDLYLVNDDIGGSNGENRLWRNDGSGCGDWCFTEVASAAGADQSLNGMGLGLGDINNDGFFDLAFSNIGEAVLLKNRGDSTFADISVTSTISSATAAYITWGTVFFDYNNDGFQDLYFTAGEVGSGGQNNTMLENDGDETFTDISAASGLDDSGRGRHISIVDFDADGFIDVLVGNYGGTRALYHNEQTVTSRGAGNNWFQVTVEGTVGNRDAIGSRIVLSTTGMTQYREINSGPTHGGGDQRLAHFGVGTETTAEISVRWPDGTWTHYGSVPTNQRLHLIEPNPALTEIYADITSSAGITHTHTTDVCTSGPPLSVGQAFGDFDNDGDADLYTVNQGGANSLYRNDGDPDNDMIPNFTDVAAGYGLQDAGKQSISAVFIDYDNDGDEDLYVTQIGGNTLWENQLIENGTVSFTDVTVTADLADDGRGITSAWGDYDNDGFLDVFIAHHVYCGSSDPRVEDTLYHNDGDGSFSEVTDILCPGTAPCFATGGAAFSPGWVDFDDDGDLDLYLVNDVLSDPISNTHNILWRNDGPPPLNGIGLSWVFSDTSKSSNTDLAVNGMGLGIGDYDNDGSFDIAFSDVGPAHLLDNDGSGVFTDVSGSSLVTSNSGGITWGTLFFDYDNDGWLDLYLVSGLIGSGGVPNIVLGGVGDGTFSNVTSGSGMDDGGRGRGAAQADVNGDGWVDVFVSNYGGAPALLLNQSAYQGNINHWLTITVEGTESNKNGIGTVVKVTAGGITQQRLISSGATHGGGDFKAAFFGLGSAANASVTIEWPNGVDEVIGVVGVDQALHYVEPFSGPTPTPSHTATSTDVGPTFTPSPTSTPTFTPGPATDTPTPTATSVAGSPYSYVEIGASMGITESHSIDGGICNPAITAGAALADFNNDGLVDIFFPNHGGANFLYQNLGDTGVDGLPDYSDVAASAGVADSAETGLASVFVDYDNDGDQDLFVSNWGGANRLYENQFIESGTADFTNLASSGLAASGRVVGAAWADFNDDGYLDVYLTKHLSCGGADPDQDQLYESNGDGTFTLVNEYLCPGGAATCAELDGTGGTIGWFDMDNDGDQDLYLVNDNRRDDQVNQLWRNDGSDGSGGWDFTLHSGTAGMDLDQWGFGLAIGDYDNDGFLDTSMGSDANTADPGAQLMTNDGDGTFTNDSIASGIEDGTDGALLWATVFMDHNNDGWLDLFFVGGASFAPGENEPNFLFSNNGNGSFTDISDGSGLDDGSRGRHGSATDFDLDGLLDVVVAHYGTAPELFHNQGPSIARGGDNWMVVTVEGTMSNRDGIGARVYLDAGGETQIREISSGASHGGGDHRIAHFGMGAETSGNLTVKWPDGTLEDFGSFSSGQYVHLVEGSTATPTPSPTPTDLPFDKHIYLPIVAEEAEGVRLARQSRAFGKPLVQITAETNLGDDYTNVTTDVGISAVHTLNGTCPAPPIGSGSAWADFDNDTDIDLFITNHGGGNWLYRNEGDLTEDDLPDFVNVSPTYNLSDTNKTSLSSVFIDYDNDGDQDLYVTHLDGNSFYENQLVETGVVSFTNVTTATGLMDDGRAITTAWGDYDQDGFLDVYVTKHRRCGGPPNDVPHNDRLFHNNGNGTFTDVTSYLCEGLSTCDAVNGLGFAPGWTDFDQDGDLDLYVVNDNIQGGHYPNVLWRNDGEDTTRGGAWDFTDISVSSKTDHSLNGMGLGVGDYDNDGFLDLAFSNVGSAVLLHNQGDGTFWDVSVTSTVSSTTVAPQGSWGTAFFDHDNDMDLDLYFVMGTIGGGGQANVFMDNSGDGMTFNDHSLASGLNDSGKARAVSWVDFDMDGFVDVFVGNYGSAPVLYHNNGNSNTWLIVTLEGTMSNRDAIGAQVYLAAGGVNQMREITSGPSHGGGDYRMAHFGMGSEITGTLSIRWPDGVMQVMGEVAANQHLNYVEPGAPTPTPTPNHLYLPLIENDTTARENSAIPLQLAASALVVLGAGLAWYLKERHGI